MRPVAITVFDSEAGTTTEYSFATSPVRIGRNPLNDLSLPFPFVSGWHAVVRFDENVAKFFDLGSTNGTLLNGRRIQAGEAVVIGQGVSLTIGKLELQLRRGMEGGAPSPEPVSAPARGPVPVMPPTQVADTPAMPAAVSMPPPAISQSPDTSRPPPRSTDHTPSSGTAHVQMGDVHQTVHQLRPLYEQYRRSWADLLGQLDGALGAMPDSVRGFALSIVAREFPGLAAEPEFDARARQAGATVATAQSRGDDGDVASVSRLAASLRPGEEPPRKPQDAARFLSAVEDVLRASAKALVELQKGQEQFGNEMGVRTIKEFTPLHAAGTAENVLKYLLDWQAGGPHRTQELVGIYADLMIHQVALINGVMEGVRSLLARLAPEEIERGVQAGWPTRAAATWKRYVERYQALSGEDKKITEIVFGPEFARAYAEVGGEGEGGQQ